VNWNRTPASGDVTATGPTSSGAALARSRLTSVPPNRKTVELASSKTTGRPKTSA